MSNSKQLQSIFSPRRIIKFFTNSIEDILDNTQPTNTVDSRLNQFLPYINSFQKEYVKYLNIQANKQKKYNQRLDEKQQLQQEIKRVAPEQFFQKDNNLKLCEKDKLFQRQQQLNGYLDEIQANIFQRMDKYQVKCFSVIDNLKQSQKEVTTTITMITQSRKKLQNLKQIARFIQCRISEKAKKSLMIEKTIKYLQLCQKMKQMKKISDQKKIDNVNFQNYQILQKLNKFDLKNTGKLLCLGNILTEIEGYRQKIKDKMKEEFSKQLSTILKQLLEYNQQQWLHNEIPIQQNLINNSILNITVLDHSFLEIQSSTKPNFSLTRLLDLNRLINLYNLQQETQIHQIVLRNLITNNAKFNKDMEDYINSHINVQKSKKIINKFQYIDIKIYTKIVKIYYQSLKNLIDFIKQVKELFPFIYKSLDKIFQFVKGRVEYYIDLKPLNQYTNKDSIIYYLQMFEYWVGEENLYLELKLIRNKVLQNHLIALQTRIQVQQLRSAIQRSPFNSISIPTNFFYIFQIVLSWSRSTKQTFHDALQMSMSMCNNSIGNICSNSNFKVIDRILVVEGAFYRISETFLYLLQYLQHYLYIYDLVDELRNSIEQKICQILGFYVWYSQKILIGSNSQPNQSNKRTLKNICLLLNISELVKYILLEFQLSTKKVTKTIVQIDQSLELIKKEISLVPLLMIEEQIQQLYQSNIKQRPTIPTNQTIRILQIFKSAHESLKQFFDTKRCVMFLNPSIKMIIKNYFGYLIGMNQRGKQQLIWFIQRLKDYAFLMFPQEITSMQKNILTKR